jgi:integrase
VPKNSVTHPVDQDKPPSIIPSDNSMAGVTITLASACQEFLDTGDFRESTKVTFGNFLRRFARDLGSLRPIASVSTAEVMAWFTTISESRKPGTVNAYRAILKVFTKWVNEEELASWDLRIKVRKNPLDATRALTRGEVERLLTLKSANLRERCYWTMLYETAARGSEILNLDIEDLDLVNRRAKVISKGGMVEYVFWQTRTARLLPRYIGDRRSGPVFVGRGRGPVALSDTEPTEGKLKRLSYRRAEQLFSRASGGKTVHQLRHSALTHAAEDGWSGPMLMARSRHRSAVSLARYARPSAEAVARMVAASDPLARRPR